MAGQPGRSGGHNRLSAAEHVLAGTFRPDRHAKLIDSPPQRVSAATRRRTLDGLSPAARRIAAGLLDAYTDWDVATLFTLRAYARSTERLDQFTQAGDDAERRRETRVNLMLLRALNLEIGR